MLAFRRFTNIWKMIQFVFISFLVTVCFGAPTERPFVWNDCSSTDSQVVNVTSVSTSPHVLRAPGSLHLSFSADVSKQIDAAILKFDFERHTFTGTKVHIPCVNQFGSCSFDACTILQGFSTEQGRNVSSQITSMFHNVGASVDCPIPAQHIKVTDFVFSIPRLSSATSLIADGDYTIKVQLLQPGTDAELGCFQFEASIERAPAPTNHGFLFG